MSRKSALFLSLFLLAAPSVQAAPRPSAPAEWPSLDSQLQRDRVVPGSALEALILENQDFTRLAPAEFKDKIRVPLWLRVHWRKAHPDMVYSASDPTGGYPFVLKEVHEWMIHHQDLRPGIPEADVAPGEGTSLDKIATVGTNLRISGAQTSPRSESDIRVNYWDTTKIISGSNNISASGQQAQFYSTDGGSTWGQTLLPLVVGDAFHSDPTVDWTSDGTAWATAMGIDATGTVLRMHAYKSADSGATWTWDASFTGAQNRTDKQMMWVDHSATSPHKDNIYMCWHNGQPQFFNRRTSTGWGTLMQLSGAESTGTAIGCDVKTNADGDVFVFWPTTGNRRIIATKSTNGGVSFGTPVVVTNTFAAFDIGVPSFNGRRILIYVSGGAYKTAAKNMVYASWSDLSGDPGCTTGANEPGSNAASNCKARIWFSRSSDGGASWSTPVKINDQASKNDQFNQWMVVDETNGQLAIIYYDTVDDATRKKTHVYYQASFDDGATWSTPFRVTTGQTDETVAGADGGNQYGDYNSLSGYAGTFFPSWTDRRNNGPEEIWTAKIEEDGTVCTPPAAPGGVTAAQVSASAIDVSWSAVAGATEYRVLRGTSPAGPFTPVGTTASTSFSDTGLDCGTSYYYIVRSFAVCESGDSDEAVAVTAACPPCSAQTLYSNDFETGTGLSDWTLGSFDGGPTTDWRGIQTCTASSGSKVFRFGGTTCTGNYANDNANFAQPGTEAGIEIPAGSQTPLLSFSHRRDFEEGFDGGTLTISLNGEDYFIVPPEAILSGTSYNDSIIDACAAISGVPSFSGTDTTFTQTLIDLDAACDAVDGNTGGCGGKSVRIGFTAITDCEATGDGWFLDDVQVTACVPDPAPPSADYYTLTPCRVIDTRQPSGPSGGPVLSPGVERSITAAGTCGVPSTARAVAVNVTVVQPTAGGYVQVYPGDAAPPVTSTINFGTGQLRSNNAIVPLASDASGTLKVRSTTTGTVHFILDVVGYFE